MVGFNAKKVAEGLNSINLQYKDVMSSVDEYQNLVIKRISEGWISPKGSKKVVQMVKDLNGVLSVLTGVCETVFMAVNSSASDVARLEETTYTPVDFLKVTAEFDYTCAKDRDGNGLVNFNLSAVTEGMTNLERFLKGKLDKNMVEIEQAMFEIAWGLNYSEFGDEILAYVREQSTKIRESLKERIEKLYDTWSAEFEEDAKKNNQTVQEVEEKLRKIELKDYASEFLSGNATNTSNVNAAGTDKPKASNIEVA